jgi:hypothetical protein
VDLRAPTDRDDGRDRAKHLRNSRETGPAYLSQDTTWGHVMDRFGQRLDAIISEVAALLWIVRATGK